MPKTSGQAPFAFSLCEDLHTLPEAARACEVDLHGGFAVDPSPGGHIYYGMPGCGLMAIAPRPEQPGDHRAALRPEADQLPRHHADRVRRQAAAGAARQQRRKGVVISLDGNLDYVLSRPEFDEYQDAETPYKPTDTAFADGTLYVADGYGANYISTVDPGQGRWQGDLRRQDRRPEGRRTVRHRSWPGGTSGRPSSVNRRPTACPLSALQSRRPLPLLARHSGRLQAVRHRLPCSVVITGTPWWAASTIPRRGGRRPSTSWTPTPMPRCPPSGRRKNSVWSWPTTFTTPCGTSTAAASI